MPNKLEYNIAVADMAPGDNIEGFYILKDASIRTTSNGKAFLAGALSDSTGVIDLKVWDYTGPLGTDKNDIGKVIKVRGEVGEFKGSRQFSAALIRLADANDQYNISELVPTAPISASETFAKVKEMINSVQDEDYRKIALDFLSRHTDSFRNLPAAKSFHHAFLHGLLMHTSNMMKLADFLAGLYSEVINRDLLITGAFLHDMAKDREFVTSPLGLVTDYSAKGQLLGHLVMGAQEVAVTAERLGVPEEKSILLQHLILSHHGEPEHGAAVVPCVAEAELLAYIDGIDSRMEIYAEQMAEMDPGDISQRIPALEKRIYKHE